MTDYWYSCRGEKVKLKSSDHTEFKHGRYFLVVCAKCCNVPVTHLLRREEKKKIVAKKA